MICKESFSQIVINEIMYSPSDATNEWFELYNAGNASVSLKNWKWKDATSALRTITAQSINLNSKSFIIICQDSNKLKTQFPLMSGRIIQTAWSALNNSGDNVILIDSANIRNDSVSYLTSWGGNTGGFSLEKINSEGASNNSFNWGTSVDLLQATPGKNNSITPKPYDLYLKSFTVSPLFPSAGETLEMNFVIKNSGMNTANDFSLNIYKDINFDSSAQDNELLNINSFSSLASADSVIHNYNIQNIDTGHKQFIAKVKYVQDEDTLNNTLIRRLYVSSQTGSSGSLIINEIMYDPLSDQTEWIELYNASGQSINIRGWKYKEVSAAVTLSAVDLYLKPGDYFILARDSTIYSAFEYLKFPNENQTVRISSGISLNNSGENISITDSLNNLIDAVDYDPGWSNPELPDTKGISLERIHPGFRSNDRSNWSSCADIRGGTPGLRNSIFTVAAISNASVTVSPNPFSPDGDGHEDFSMIKYKLNSSFAQMRVKVFDIRGRLVRELANNQISGSEGTIIFNGLGDDNKKLRIGIYILLIEAIDDRGGNADVVKKPIVIAGKL